MSYDEGDEPSEGVPDEWANDRWYETFNAALAGALGNPSLVARLPDRETCQRCVAELTSLAAMFADHLHGKRRGS